MPSSFEPQSLDSTGDHSHSASPVCESATLSVGDEPCTRCEPADDSAHKLFSSPHSLGVSANATTY